MLMSKQSLQLSPSAHGFNGEDSSRLRFIKGQLQRHSTQFETVMYNQTLVVETDNIGRPRIKEK